MASLVKRSFSLAGHRTSVALEPEFWQALAFFAEDRGRSVASLVAEKLLLLSEERVMDT